MQVFRTLADAEAAYAVLKAVYAGMGIKLPLPSYLKERIIIMSEGWLKKRVLKAGDAVRTGALKVAASDLQICPALVEFLSCEVWPDGTERKPGTLLLFVDQGKAKACLSDRDQGLVLFFTVDCLATLLEAADDVLKDESADWRPAKGGTQSRRSK